MIPKKKLHFSWSFSIIQLATEIRWLWECISSSWTKVLVINVLMFSKIAFCFLNLIKFLELYNKIRIDSSILEINLVPFFFFHSKTQRDWVCSENYILRKICRRVNQFSYLVDQVKPRAFPFFEQNVGFIGNYRFNSWVLTPVFLYIWDFFLRQIWGANQVSDDRMYISTLHASSTIFQTWEAMNCIVDRFDK